MILLDFQMRVKTFLKIIKIAKPCSLGIVSVIKKYRLIKPNKKEMQ